MKRFAMLCATLLATSACNDEITGLEPPSNPATEVFADVLEVDIASMTKTAEGVYYKDLTVGTGTEIVSTTDSVFVTYAGYLKDGKLFDSGTNVKFDPDNLIAGFRVGMLGMKEGGKRKLVIPSELGYGPTTLRNPDGTTKIPRQSTLVFDVEVLKVHNPPPPETGS